MGTESPSSKSLHSNELDGNVSSLLKESEERFRIMADCAPVLLWMSGTNSDCNFFNQTWLKYTGRTLEQELGVGWAEGVYHEDLQMALDVYMKSFHARQPFEMEYRLKRHDGVYRWMIDHGRPRFNADGSFAGFIGSCVDISDRKQAELDLKKLADNLLSINQELQHFVHAASHDLREPIRMIVNFSELIAARLGNGVEPSIKEYCNHVIAAGKRLSKLVDSLFSYARLGREGCHLEEVDCNLLIDELMQEFNNRIKETNATVTRRTLPVVRFDRSRLGQVFHNLISNSLKFHNNQSIHVDIACREEAAEWIFSVRDDGIGIDSKDSERVFEAFKKLHAQDKFPGSGLGLAICRKIIQAQGGAIWLESDVGKGTEFFFSIPKNQGSSR